MTDEEIQAKSSVWRMVHAMGFEEAAKRLARPAIKVGFSDTERLRKTADLLDEESDSYSIAYSVQGKFPDDDDGRYGQAKLIRLESASKHLRNLSVRLDGKLVPINIKENAIGDGSPSQDSNEAPR